MSSGPTKPMESYPVADPSELPLPPPPGAEGEPGAAPAAPVERQARAAEMAVLQFLDPAAIEREVPLSFPFMHEGREVRDIRIRRLAVAEVGAIMERHGAEDPVDLYEFYEVMCGLPAAVLRGLIDDDGYEVLNVARPLLPRFAERMFFGQTSAPGGVAQPAQPAT